MKITLFRVFLGILIALSIMGGVIYLWYTNKHQPQTNQSIQSSNTPTTSTATTQAVPSSSVSSSAQTSSSLSSISEFQLPYLEELKAKTADWLTYTNQDYKFQVKYPMGWDYYDKQTYPYTMPKFIEYDAIEVFNNHKLFNSENGAGTNLYYSNNLSRIPTKEFIAADIEKRYQWHIPHQTHTFF